MNTFLVDSKKGFLSSDKMIQIFDNDNKPFYIKINHNKIIYFNLPEGIYKTENRIKQASEPRVYNLHPLPNANEQKKLPKSFKIFFTKNPNKCSVDPVNNIIYFDYSFKDKIEPIMIYVKLHELGHYFYSGEGIKSEMYCDWFAYNNMIDLGYNPSQVRAAIFLTLSDRPDALERKKFIYEISK